MMHVCYAHQETPTDLEKYLKQGESIKKAFELVAEHGYKTVNRFAAMLEGQMVRVCATVYEPLRA